MKQLLIDEEAERELAASVTFYEQRRAGLGLEFATAAERAVRVIQEAPERWPLDKHVWIVAFAHTSRKPGDWRSRLE